MTQALIDNLPLIAAAPDGIKALRGLILDLAVRGKLVPQDPEDEPASELLYRVAAEKTRKSRATKNKGRKTELADPGSMELPLGWSSPALEDVVTVLNGRAYAKGELLDAGVPVLRVGNLFTSNSWYYSDLELEADKYCDAGDLLFAWSASFGPHIWQGPKVIYHYHIWKLEPHSPADFDTKYAYYFLLAKTQEIKAAGHGVSMVHMTKEKMERIRIPLPPLAEQRRIVAKVDELMALCDRMEVQQTDAEAVHANLVKTLLDTLTQSQNADDFTANWHRLSQHFPTIFTTEASVDALKQTVLQLAVSGTLSSRIPSDVPASLLLKSISEEKGRQIEAGGIRRQSALTHDRPDGGDGQLPDTWVWTRIDDTFHVSGGIQKTPARHPRQNAYPYVGVGNVYRAFIDLTSVSSFELQEGELEKFCLEVGDILVVEGNGSANEIGRCAVWNGAIPQCVHQNHIIRCRPIDKSIVPYVQLYLNSPQGIDVMKSLAVTSSGLFNLSVGKIRSISIPLPPLAEQHRIVAKVDELMALCGTLKEQIVESRKVQHQLTASLVDQALAA